MTLLRILKKFRQILSRHQKIRILELAALMIVGSFMEMLSVSLILPFVQAVMSPESVMTNAFVQMVCRLLGIENHRTFLVFLALVMAFLYILKNCFLLFQLTVQHRFVYNNMFTIQQKLLRGYFSRPYEYFLGVKSGEVFRVIGSDTEQAFKVLTEILFLFSELVVSGALLITIFVISPEITIEMAVLLWVLTLFIQKMIRPILKKAGQMSQKAHAGMNQWIFQAIQGIKEVKLMRCENYFEKKFEQDGRVYVKTRYQNQTLSVIPRFMIEAVMMCTFFVLIAVMIYRGAKFEYVIPILSGMAMATVRLLPSVNRISASMAEISFGEPAVDKMIENLQELSDYHVEKSSVSEGERKLQPLSGQIELSNITYQYPAGDKNILEDASMKIRKGMSIGIVGISGAGKTTAADVLLGLLKPQKGRVLLDGVDIQTDIEGWISQIGYIPQSIFMLDGDIRENVAFGVLEEDVDEDMVWTALKEAAMDEFVKSLPEGLHTQLGERGIRLSGGQRQRIGIARALYLNPSVLFFDEATSALDNDTETAIMDSINYLRGTKTMVIIAHRLTTIAGCDRVYRVENGKIQREK